MGEQNIRHTASLFGALVVQVTKSSDETRRFHSLSRTGLPPGVVGEIGMFRQPSSVSDWRAEAVVVVVHDRETSEGLSTQVREHCRYAGKN
jgi:hypothetical protein